MSVNRIAENLIAQFEKSWKMLQQAIEKVPDAKWTDSVQKIDKPWQGLRPRNPIRLPARHRENS